MNAILPNSVKESDRQLQSPDMPMAIVGLSCRFPGSIGAEEFYRSLIGGADLFSPPPRERWPWCTDDRILVPAIGALDRILEFDNGLFRLSPREAETIDPHQRLMLEEVWLAVENAGYSPEGFRRRPTGVFVAMYNHDFQFYARAGDWDEISRIYLAAGSARSMAPNRVSYTFDLRGPSELVDTACSSALVAVHRAVEAIRHGECEQAVVGGVSLLLEPSRLVMLQELGLLSPTGACKPFDRDSRGQVLGEGVAALIVKPLQAALADRDTIHALVVATGVNHQGASSGGLTRPSSAAQADLIRHTYVRHGLDRAEVCYVEGHGSGGGGDLSEILAFQDAFGDGVHVGSVKGNIGFLEAAGGLSQIIKLIMAIKHGVMPATRAHRQLLDDGALRQESVRIVHENTPIHDLKTDAGKPFLAAAHAYGLGGCNAHVVLSEAPACDVQGAGPFPILLSGEDFSALSRSADCLRQYLEKNPHASVPDIAFTLAAGRSHKTLRTAFYTSEIDDLRRRLAVLATDPEAKMGSATVEDTGMDDAVRQWLAGGDIDWRPRLPQGRRIGLPSAPLRRRVFPLPAIVRPV